MKEYNCPFDINEHRVLLAMPTVPKMFQVEDYYLTKTSPEQLLDGKRKPKSFGLLELL